VLTLIIIAVKIELKGVDHMAEKVKTSLAIDEEIWIEAKIAATRRRITLTEYFEEALKEKLERKANKDG